MRIARREVDMGNARGNGKLGARPAARAPLSLERATADTALAQPRRSVATGPLRTGTRLTHARPCSVVDQERLSHRAAVPLDEFHHISLQYLIVWPWRVAVGVDSMLVALAQHCILIIGRIPHLREVVKVIVASFLGLGIY